jgi:hypothetical protein
MTEDMTATVQHKTGRPRWLGFRPGVYRGDDGGDRRNDVEDPKQPH